MTLWVNAVFWSVARTRDDRAAGLYLSAAGRELVDAAEPELKSREAQSIAHLSEMEQSAAQRAVAKAVPLRLSDGADRVPGAIMPSIMQIRFTKMQGAGNDFVVLDETQARLGLNLLQYRYLANRPLWRGCRPDSDRPPPPRQRAWILNTSFTTPTAARWNNAAMARAALPAMYMTKGADR